MDNTAIQQIRDAITQNTTIGIAVGQNPSLDTMAAALGLYLSLKDAQKGVSIASATEPIVAISNLVGIDKVKTSLSGEGGDLIVSFPYREGEIEKISYTLEQDKLNIVVKAGTQGLQFNESEVAFTRSGNAPKLLFVIGTQTLSQLGSLFDAEKLKDTQIVNIDNKRENQSFGDIVYVSQTASSVSEQVASLLTLLQLPIQVDTAQNLLSGIIDATANFQNGSASTFEMAGMLMKAGATRQVSQPAQPSLQSPQMRQTRPPMPAPADMDDDFLSDPFLNNRPAPAPRPFPRPANQMPKPFPKPFPNPMTAPTPAPTPAQMPPMPFGAQPQQKPAPAPRPAPAPFLQRPASQQRPVVQPQQAADNGAKKPPSDWLTPKIYKGSTQV